MSESEHQQLKQYYEDLIKLKDQENNKFLEEIDALMAKQETSI